jgi:hypothetical protein
LFETRGDRIGLPQAVELRHGSNSRSQQGQRPLEHLIVDRAQRLGVLPMQNPDGL